MTASETEIVESCRSLGMDPADLFRPISRVEIRQECATRTFRAHSIASLAD